MYSVYKVDYRGAAAPNKGFSTTMIRGYWSTNPKNNTIPWMDHG